MYTISAFSKMTQLTAKSLRYYEEQGLLKPVGRSERGYRLYDDANYLDAERIKFLRQLSFSIAEISDVMDNCSRDEDLYDYLIKKRDCINRNIRKECELVNRISRYLSETDKPESSRSECCEQEIHRNRNQQLLDCIICYAQKNSRIQALILIGSQARTEDGADEYSDIDLILITDTPDFFISTDEWLHEIDTPHISFVESSIGGSKEKRVLFHHALDVDFMIIAQEHAENVFRSTVGADILSRGYKILVNKKDLAILPVSVNQSRPELSEAEFLNIVNDFWFHAVWSLKKLQRKEYWSAKFCVDGYMKTKLLWMIEQYEHVKHGEPYNTWYNGRFIDRWADREIIDDLRNTFAHYEDAEIKAALIATMDLFRRLAIVVSAESGYAYPVHADAYAANWVREVG